MKKPLLFFGIGCVLAGGYHFAMLGDYKELLAVQDTMIILQDGYIETLEKRLEKKFTRKVVLTAYTPTKDQCDSDPLIAASMRKVRLGTVAVSRDLFAQGWVFGRKVYIKGHGVFEINDLMNSRFKVRIDIFMWDKDRAIKFGKKRVLAALLDI